MILDVTGKLVAVSALPASVQDEYRAKKAKLAELAAIPAEAFSVPLEAVAAAPVSDVVLTIQDSPPAESPPLEAAPAEPPPDFMPGFAEASEAAPAEEPEPETQVERPSKKSRR